MEELWLLLRPALVADLDASFGHLYLAEPKQGEGAWVYGEKWAFRDGDDDGGFAPPTNAFDDGKVKLRGLANNEVAAFRWVWRGRDVHDDERPDLAPRPTGRAVEIHGITLAWDAGEGEIMFQRFVDWTGLFTQLGMSIGRPVFDAS